MKLYVVAFIVGVLGFSAAWAAWTLWQDHWTVQALVQIETQRQAQARQQTPGK